MCIKCQEAGYYATPIPSLEEWERRFKARIVQRLTGPDSIWDGGDAEQAAKSEFDSVDIAEIRDGYERRPEDSADESLSYWEDGV